MTTPCSPDPISASQIQTEFGGTNPIGLNEYYGVAAGVPASGVISYNDLRCKSHLIFATYHYTSPGTYSRTIPAGVATVGYAVQAAGGAGAAGRWDTGFPNYIQGDGGGGGASGELRSGSFAVSAGQTLIIVVGDGGNTQAYTIEVGGSTGEWNPGDGYPDNLANHLNAGGYAGSGAGGNSQLTNGVSNIISYGGLGGVFGEYSVSGNPYVGGGGANTTGSTGAVDMWGGGRASTDYGGFGGSSYFGGSGDWYYRYTNKGFNGLVGGTPAAASAGAGGCGAKGGAGSAAQNGAPGRVSITWNTTFGYPAFYQARYGQGGGQL